ncbi:PREDICTED: tRNA (adenine(58)-N(1))-methyltransferase catalytic subunit TRMT61A [Vollenhovia emeryi]|uniref:tRNA (adenine(58)-N(1))-methyltransferase catalytic subunit TRMT61A n=1 Tax=Vollenhovia emeryi TaxID=411798 RepID=UPI0005F38C73|nr:PREDICTED: tRNA (adenine(58)-N(1))-methyltransferase catalytic subunit TRMT61A [Vollenhovia emeryi]XP_011874662.1 PREDICTED: tRNA (adenine(58)-N(1))-methyltransferase catalytic subunit TRMT61A [Vollenhovia emeryi]XP_011874663.1 PREDICTED: tRNA (adenine(58)-N(1))-methyltransferase catalytic subunit TRMT61A [Vollenhovia emeryi]XP_011874664.1 PREDICTED: tRNA (adenine(58)-N(1))-methyltransferase catalytic subunit TRMT61A [Vollenhovia emeryi]
MSFKTTKEIIEDGDIVVLYLNPSNMHSLEVKEKIFNKKGELIDNMFHTTYGALRVVSLIGQKYGSKVKLSRGWAYVLQPTPELWTLTLPHRTQIIYSPDISLIIHLMELRPGSTVIETGTGSGSLSHSLIRAIRPSGHLYTFDFHEQRVSIASTEFKNHGLSDFVTLKERDVCLEGFGDELRDRIDAVFLDLPHPWLAIEHAIVALKQTGGKLCFFSPCIEQVQRTCAQLICKGFIELLTYECLQREMNVQYKSLPVLDLECLKYKQANEDIVQKDEKGKQEEKLLTVTHAHSLPGHTGFITIAVLPPSYARK